MNSVEDSPDWDKLADKPELELDSDSEVADSDRLASVRVDSLQLEPVLDIPESLHMMRFVKDKEMGMLDAVPVELELGAGVLWQRLEAVHRR